MVTPSRRVAFHILCDVESGGFASNLLKEQASTLNSQDAGLATEIVLGVLRRRSQLRFLLSKVSSRSIPGLDTPVRIALEMGAYQLRFLDRVPMHAAVMESVDLVKYARQATATGFVNACLRQLPPLPRVWPDEQTRLSIPVWILERWTGSYGAETAAVIAEHALQTPDVWVRVPAGAPVPEGLEPAAVPGAYRAIAGTPAGVRVQDISSQAIVPLLELQPGQRFLDLCAAPGNKTAQALETPDLIAVACDASPSRLKRLLVPDGACARVRLDAARPLPFGPVFDRILVDAPCSGTGTLAHNPEIKWRLTPEEIRRHASRQQSILRQALACLRPGGRLVYATCSLEPEENEGVVHAVAPSRVIRTMRRLPGRNAGDGFHASVLT